MRCTIDIIKLSEIVAERALKIVLKKLEEKGIEEKSIADQDDLQHVSYTLGQMGYDK